MRKVFPTFLAATALSLIPLASAQATPSSTPGEFNDNWQLQSCGQFYDLKTTPTAKTTVKELQGTGVAVKHTQYKWVETDDTYLCDTLYLQGTPKAVQSYTDLKYSTKLSGDVVVGDAFDAYVPGFVAFNGQESATDAYGDLAKGYQYPLFSYVYTDEVTNELGADKAALIGHPELADSTYVFTPDEFSYNVTLSGDGQMTTTVAVDAKKKAQALKVYNASIKTIEKWADKKEAQIKKHVKDKKNRAKQLAKLKDQEAKKKAQALKVYKKLVADKEVTTTGAWTRSGVGTYGF